MNKVWWVESGEYSDYSVNGVFSSEENAKLYANTFGGDVVETELDPTIPELRDGFRCYRVYMSRDGRAKCATEGDIGFSPNVILSQSYRGGTGILFASLLVAPGWFKSEEHAIKACNEKRLQLIAVGEWPPDPEGSEDRIKRMR